MPILNPFANDAFTAVELSAAINRLPNMYGRAGQLGLFPTRGVRTRTIILEERNGVLNLLPTKAPGSPGTVGNRAKRKVRSFTIPHIPHDDAVKPEEVQGIRAFGSETELEMVSNVVAEKLADMRNRHAITLEWLRMGALKGLILDSDGSTLFNLFTEFGVTQLVVNFALTTGTTNVLGKCHQVSRHVEDNLLGDVMSRVGCLCGEDFYDSFTNHANVKAAFANWQAAQERLGGDMRRGFPFGGIVFEEYRGRAIDEAATVRPFIAKNEAHFFPIGTASSFYNFFAPADFNETVNTPGQELYARMKEEDYGRGWGLHTQSNPLPICLRPGTLVKGTLS